MTAALAFIAARRLTRGKVETTTAERLWEEAAGIRRDYAHEIGALRDEVRALREEAHHKDMEIYQLRQEVVAVRKLNEDMEWAVGQKTQRIVTLEREMAELKAV